MKEFILKDGQIVIQEKIPESVVELLIEGKSYSYLRGDVSPRANDLYLAKSLGLMEYYGGDWCGDFKITDLGKEMVKFWETQSDEIFWGKIGDGK
jgi:hypothetical protein